MLCFFKKFLYGLFYKADMAQKSVLIVDDDRPTRKLVKRLLDENFFGFFYVRDIESSEKALTLIEHLKFHFVLCDGEMPGMDGIELYDRVYEFYEKKGQRPPSFIICSDSPLEFEMPALQRGILFLKKPIDKGDLVHIMEKTLLLNYS